ncbi:MAG: Gfo/Idh/MocA family oxidoreductase [Humidesulfovibrio sp.]|nr:Gfo/Idh/MocA family oxidoreductase [Humidesulfovibrio sp.]
MRIAQLGAGYWGPNLIRNFLRVPEVTSFQVGDPDEKQLAKVRGMFPQLQTGGDLQSFAADPSIDAVVLATPAATHYEFTKLLLNSGKHVLVEKPLALNARDGRELVDLAREKKLILMVGHVFLYNAAVLKVKEYIDAGDLGEIYYITTQRLSLGRVRQDVNALWNLAPHDISICNFWLDAKPERVTAKGKCFLQPHLEDVVFMDLDYPGGQAAHVHVSWLDPNKTRRIVVVGSKRMLVYDDVSMDAKITIYDKGVDRNAIPRDLPSAESFGDFQLQQREGDIIIPKIKFNEPLFVECTEFVRCILEGRVPKADGENGLAVVEVMDQAQRQLDDARR